MHDQPGPTPATERTDAEDTGEAVLAGSALRRRGWFRRLASQRLTARIALLNLLGLIILVAGILYFNQFHQGLIDARVQSLTTQAQIIAAAVAPRRAKQPRVWPLVRLRARSSRTSQSAPRLCKWARIKLIARGGIGMK